MSSCSEEKTHTATTERRRVDPMPLFMTICSAYTFASVDICAFARRDFCLAAFFPILCEWICDCCCDLDRWVTKSRAQKLQNTHTHSAIFGHLTNDRCSNERKKIYLRSNFLMEWALSHAVLFESFEKSLRWYYVFFLVEMVFLFLARFAFIYFNVRHAIIELFKSVLFVCCAIWLLFSNRFVFDLVRFGGAHFALHLSSFILIRCCVQLKWTFACAKHCVAPCVPPLFSFFSILGWKFFKFATFVEKLPRCLLLLGLLDSICIQFIPFDLPSSAFQWLLFLSLRFFVLFNFHSVPHTHHSLHSSPPPPSASSPPIRQSTDCQTKL